MNTTSDNLPDGVLNEPEFDLFGEDEKSIEYRKQLWIPVDLLDSVTHERIVEWKIKNLSHYIPKEPSRNPIYSVNSTYGQWWFRYNPNVDWSREEALIRAQIRYKEVCITKNNNSPFWIFSDSMSKDWILWFRVVLKDGEYFLIVNRKHRVNKKDKKLDLSYNIAEFGWLCKSLKDAINKLKKLYWIETLDLNLAKQIAISKKAYTEWTNSSSQKDDIKKVEENDLLGWLNSSFNEFKSTRNDEIVPKSIDNSINKVKKSAEQIFLEELSQL